MSWSARMRYAISQAWQQRRALRALARKPQCHCQQVTQITAEQLVQAQVTGLVLDFDGVLAPHGDLAPLPQVVDWLEKLTESFPPDQIFILSNKPMLQRRTWFTTHFPQIHFVSGVRKKPYPDGLQSVVKKSGIPVENLVLVDDRLLTGMLATILAKSQGIWVTRAYCRLSIKNPKELFFFMLRSMEKWVF